MVAKLAAAVSWIALIALSLARTPVPDPPLGSHCACERGTCPLDANGRSCSCGCAKRADAQPLQRLDALPDVTCTDGMAGAYPCNDIDLLAFLPHGDIGGGTGNDIWGWTDPLTGRDTRSSAARPAPRSWTSRPRASRSISATCPPHRRFDVARHQGLRRSRVHRQRGARPRHAGLRSDAASQCDGAAGDLHETAHYAGFGSTHTLAINSRTGFAYAAGTRTCEGGLHVVDVRTPAAPRAAGCFSFDGYTHETQCVVYDGPDTVYRDREICFNSNEDTLTIVDATDKLEQVQLSRTGYGGSAYTHQGWLTEDQRFFLVNDEGDEIAFKHPTRTWIWDVSDLDAPVLASLYDGPTPSIDHNLYIRGNLVYESNYRSGLRVLDASEIAARSAARGRVLRYLPVRRRTGLQRRVVGVSVLRQRLGGGQWHRAGPVRRQTTHHAGRSAGRPLGHDRRPRQRRTDRSDWSFVVMVANHGPGRLTETRVIEMPPGDAQLLSARASQGECSIGAVATCDLGCLAPGSEAFVIITIRAAGERDFISTAVASAKADDGTNREASALTTTRGIRYAPALTLRRPASETTFRIGRNNTIQWTLRGVAGGVSIDLSRDDGETWTRLTDEAENVGFYDWTGTGVLTSRAKIRVTSLVRPELTQPRRPFRSARR